VRVPSGIIFNHRCKETRPTSVVQGKVGIVGRSYTPSCDRYGQSGKKHGKPISAPPYFNKGGKKGGYGGYFGGFGR
jgi:hypothetical protein